MNAVAYALLAVIASEAGDRSGAERHLHAARRLTSATARRERQLVEIATLVVTGQQDRARGLSYEHRAEFAEDADLLGSLLVPPLDPAPSASSEIPGG